MKFKCKIKDKYLKQILKGEKKVEYRQVESIIFVDEHGKEYEFEVEKVGTVSRDYGGLGIMQLLKKKYPDVWWKDNLPTIAIRLGRRIR